MSKLETCVFLLLAAFLTVEGLIIQPLPLTQKSGKFFPDSQVPANVRPNDPRCKENGVFANVNDCTSYYACRDGTSQDRKCPEGMKFDSRRHCTFEKDPDCGATTQKSINSRLDCPLDNGIFPYKEDCRQYVVCVDAVPVLKKCPEQQWYQDNVGCVEGTTCPKSQNAHPVCKKANGVYPDLANCKRYIKCTNWVPEVKTCPVGKAFDSHKKRCWKAEEVKCRKSNDVSEIMEDN